MKGLYIHIPFCEAICTYCDFAKELAKPEKKASYIEALIEEIKHYKESLIDVDSIYIGGGTPSSLDNKELTLLLAAIKSSVDLDQVNEYTIECNPNDVNQEKANLFKQYGINRISLGVQTFNEQHLRFLNRKHRNHHVEDSIKMFKAAEIENISIDLIFSLVGQTTVDVARDLSHFLTLGINHVSYYSLIFEEDTKLYHLYEQGKVKMNDESLEAEMYETIIETLVSEGYEHYEISNFAKNNKQSYHNTIYWKNKDYIGLGAGAHGKINSSRYANIRSAKKYIEAVQKDGTGIDCYYPYEAKRDYLLMGLRLLEGINLDDFEKRFNQSIFDAYPSLDQALSQGLLEKKGSYLRFTRKGLFLGNEVFAQF